LDILEGARADDNASEIASYGVKAPSAVNSTSSNNAPPKADVDMLWTDSLVAGDCVDGKAPSGDWETAIIGEISPSGTEISVTWSTGINEWVSLDSGRFAKFGTKCGVSDDNDATVSMALFPSVEVTAGATKGAQSSSATPTPNEREFTAAEVARHNTEGDCWIVLGSAVTGGAKVYDVTRYLDEHPGGAEIILEYAGETGSNFLMI
jgi:hypothetical protein